MPSMCEIDHSYAKLLIIAIIFQLIEPRDGKTVASALTLSIADNWKLPYLKTVSDIK